MTIVPLRYWLLVALMVFTSGCASPEMTTRNCIIQLAQQLGQSAFAATLICEKEEPFKAEQK